MTQVRLQINGERGVITVDALVTALQRTQAALRGMDRVEALGRGDHGPWRVGEVWNGSIGVVLEAPPGVSDEVPTRFVDGLAILEERPELPPWFPVSAVQGVEGMGRVLRAPGVEGLEVSAVGPTGEEVRTRVTRAAVDHAKQAFGGTDEALGSVSGVLDIVNSRQAQLKVSLYDPGGRHAVRGTVQGQLREEVRAYFGARVRASGLVTRNSMGQIASVKVDSFALVEEPSHVPSVVELTGIAPWYTGERTAVEHQRWTRGA